MKNQNGTGNWLEQEEMMGEPLPLQELIDFNELQDIQDGFAKVICTSSVIFSPEGDALTRFSNPTGFCSLIQSTKVGMRCCFQSFADMGQKVLESDAPVLMRCFAHGAHFAAPIIIDGERKATMFMGQFITEEFSPDRLKELREIAAHIDVDPDRLVAEAKKMRVVKEDVVRNYTTALSQTVGVIARLGAQAVELVRAKDALQESHDELESRVKERTAELARTNTGLKREIAERKLAEDHVERLNSVLKAIRNVNQLIVSEKDRGSLLRKACDILLEARGYDAAWFGLLRDDATFEMVLGSDSRHDPSQFCDDMVGRDPSQCFKDALTCKERITIVDKSVKCKDCTFRSAYLGNATVIVRVEHAGRLFGLLAIALAADVDVDVTADADEKELLKEVASDIAFALHGIELDEARKAIENALREGEEKYRTLIENIQDGVFLIQDGELKFVNEAFARIPGYTVEEILGMNFRDLVAPEDLDMVTDRYTRMMAGEDVPMEYEFHGIRKGEDARITIHMTVGLIEYHGKPAALGTVKDITEHRAMEDALRESEIMYRALYDSSRDAIMMLTPEEGFFSGNSATLEMLGCKDGEEFTSMTPADISPEYQPDGSLSLPESQKAMAIAMEKGSHSFEWKHRRMNGEEFFADVLLTKVELDRKKFLQATVRDITRRKIAEAALRESEEKYRTLIENIQDGVFLIHDGDLKFVNEAFARIPGYTVEEILGMNFGGLVAPEDRDMVADRYTRMMAGEDVPMEYEFRGIRKGEDMRTTVRMTVGLTEYQGKPAVIGTVKDVTERKQMEEALLESEEKYRVLFETAKDAIFLADETGKFVDVNQAACESLGYSKEELLKLTVGEIDAESTGYEAFQKVRNSIEKESIFGVNQQRKDGAILPVEITGGFLKIGAKKIFLTIARDITERKRLDEWMHRVNEELEERVAERTAELKHANEQLNATIAQVYHAQKMESLGILAGGIAHDFNNLLTITLGNISIAKTIADPEEKLFRMLSDAEKASLRARDLTLQLLAFSRSGEPIKRTIRIANLIEDSAIFAQRGSNVQCEFEIPDDLMSVDADEGQIGQVVSNIIINACQAMPDGGTIRVKCENVAIGAAAGEAGDPIPLAGGDYVRISIKDEGAGIPEEQINRIFDPFFTTKEEGTGLGLATAHSIIEKHGGYLTVESTVGLGSTFYVYLPAAKEGVLAESAPETAVGDDHGAGDAGAIASGRILVLDDEEDIRELLGMILVRFGYVVEFSGDGAETIDRYRGAMGSDQAFDVVIVDLTIPGGIGGGDVIRELIRIDPGARAIVSSGYANDPMMLDYRKYGFSGAISKPYEVKDLIRTVREVIGAEEGSYEPD
jgi:PAS domain S-box-containing protein